MKAKCPKCKKMNEIVPAQDGFYFDGAQYKCECGYFVKTTALNLTEAVKQLRKELKKK